MASTPLPRIPLSRRQALAVLAGAAAGGSLTARQAFAQAGEAALATILPANVCVLTPQAIEGPYYFDPNLVRANITEGRPGIPTRLMLQVIEAASCAPIEGARVDIWHCDATGLYSGYSGQGDDGQAATDGEVFLRGTQMTDAAGIVTFETLYPGWYSGRTTHVHVMVFLDEQTVLISQIYFPDALSEFIYTNVSPYTDRATPRDTYNAADFVLAASGGHDSFCSIKEDDGFYLASLVIGVDRTAEAQGGAGPGDGPLPDGLPADGPMPEGSPGGSSGGSGGGASLVPGGGG
jgi:protocatechuate 3,4-dioxygenase beta subunit